MQALILEENPYAMYCPCSAHSLNLCGVHAVESNIEVKCFFGNIQKLYSFFSTSPLRWKVLQDSSGISLHKTSSTRWSARIDAVRPLVKRPREIHQALNKLKEEFDLPDELQNEVTALIAWLHSFEFVILATFWFKVLQAINDVNCLLQSPKITLDEEIKLLKSLLETLQHF